MKFAYPAVFTKEQNGMYSVDFPNIEGCYTCGKTREEAIENAEDILKMVLTLIAMENNGYVPDLSAVGWPYDSLEYMTKNEYEIVMITCDLDL